MSAQCFKWKRNLPHFSPLNTNSFALTSLRIQGSEFGNLNVRDYFSITIEFSIIIVRDSNFYRFTSEKKIPAHMFINAFDLVYT